MTPGAIQSGLDCYFTENSAYLVDRDNRRYRRVALRDQAVHSHRLTYDEWHEYARVAVEQPDGPEWAFRAPETRPSVLRIWTPDAVHGIITTPIVDVLRNVPRDFDPKGN